MEKLKYAEKQRFRDWTLFALLLFLIGLGIWRFMYDVFVSGVALESNKWLLYLLVEIVLIVVAIKAYQARLSVKINRKGIRVKWRTWQDTRRWIQWDEIKSCDVVRCSNGANWSGWNIRFRWGKNDCYYFRPRGIELHLKDDSRVFIGLRQPGRAARLIDQMIDDRS